jgi:hypothetical protein
VKITSKSQLFHFIENQFQCTRIAIASEPNPIDNGNSYFYHALFELRPPVMYKNVDGRIRTFFDDFTLVSLNSFGLPLARSTYVTLAGLKYILASEPNPAGAFGMIQGRSVV